MNTARRITANFLSLLSSEIAAKLLQLLIFVYLARAFGTEDFGTFSFGLAFALLIVIIADFGLSTLLVREMSRDKKAASKYISNAIVVKVFLAIITVIAASLFLNFMDYSNEAKLVAYIMLSFTILQSFTDLYYSVFRAFERMHYDASIKLLRMLVLVGIIFYALKNNFSLANASMAFPITEAFILLITVILVYARFIRISLEFDYAFSKEILKKSSFFCLSIVFSGLFMYIDQIMLSKLRGSAEVGIYAAASNIMIALIFIPLMYANAIYPVISRLFVSSKETLKFAYERSFKYMLIIGIAASAGIFALSGKIVSLLYGEEYASTAVVLTILSGYLFLRFANVISGFALSSINRQGSRVVSQGIAALINIILNFILIPVYGFVGAAVATLITEILLFSEYLFFVSRYGLGIRFARLFIRPVVAALIMIAALSVIESLLLSVVIGAVVYLGILFLLGAIDREDKRIINKAIKNI